MRKIRVLIAIKHAAFSESLRQVLSHEQDIEVVATAGDGEETVKTTAKLMPDVAIIDVDMPKLGGIDIARQIKTNSPATAIIILSEYEYGLHLLPSLRAGALGYLLKTCSLCELIGAIRAVHAGEEVFDAKVAGQVLRLLAQKTDVEFIPPTHLHARELEVLKLAAKGMHNKEIARKLSVSERTVQTHLVNIFRKLGVASRVEAALYALKRGWFTFNDLS